MDGKRNLFGEMPKTTLDELMNAEIDSFRNTLKSELSDREMRRMIDSAYAFLSKIDGIMNDSKKKGRRFFKMSKDKFNPVVHDVHELLVEIESASYGKGIDCLITTLEIELEYVIRRNNAHDAFDFFEEIQRWQHELTQKGQISDEQLDRLGAIVARVSKIGKTE